VNPTSRSSGDPDPFGAILRHMRDDDHDAVQDHGKPAGDEAYVPPQIVSLGTLHEMTRGRDVGEGDVDIPGVISF
jgi:hypothetical protein